MARRDGTQVHFCKAINSCQALMISAGGFTLESCRASIYWPGQIAYFNISESFLLKHLSRRTVKKEAITSDKPYHLDPANRKRLERCNPLAS